MTVEPTVEDVYKMEIEEQIVVECNCDCSCKDPATMMHPVLEKVMVCSDCFKGLEAEFPETVIE